MDTSGLKLAADAPVCPKCAGAGKQVGAHDQVTYYRCLSCSRIWAQRRD